MSSGEQSTKPYTPPFTPLMSECDALRKNISYFEELTSPHDGLREAANKMMHWVRLCETPEFVFHEASSHASSVRELAHQAMSSDDPTLKTIAFNIMRAAQSISDQLDERAQQVVIDRNASQS